MANLRVTRHNNHGVKLIYSFSFNEKRDVVDDYRVRVVGENVRNSLLKFCSHGGVDDVFEILARDAIVEHQSTESGTVQFAIGRDNTEPETLAYLIEGWASAPLDEPYEFIGRDHVRA